MTLGLGQLSAAKAKAIELHGVEIMSEGDSGVVAGPGRRSTHGRRERLEAGRWLTGIATFTFALSCMTTSSSHADPREAQATVVFRRPSPVAEPSEAELDRIFGRFTQEDSSRWIRGLTPGEGVVWISKDTRLVRVHLTTEIAGDSVKCHVGYERSTILQLPAMRSDSARSCIVTWDLRDSRRKRIGPGLYSMHIRAGGVERELLVIQPPTRAEDGWRLRY